MSDEVGSCYGRFVASGVYDGGEMICGCGVVGKED